MRIEICIEEEEGYFEHEGYYNTIEEAINALYKLQKQTVLTKIEQYVAIRTLSRCSKCVYTNTCPNIDINGSCKSYKRDPPDGGYYG